MYMYTLSSKLAELEKEHYVDQKITHHFVWLEIFARETTFQPKHCDYHGNCSPPS